jgi:hypothetical protein
MTTDISALDSVLSAGWCLLPKKILFDAKLTDKQKLLYAFISSYTSERGYCWASNAYLAQKFDCTEKWVSTCINQIKRRGYFKVLLIRDGITDEVKQRRIYLATPTPGDVFTPSPSLQGGVSHKKRGGTPQKQEYNKERILKKEEEETKPATPFSFQPHQTAKALATIFGDTDPETDFQQKDIANLIYRTMQDVSMDDVKYAHHEQTRDEKRRQKGETGFAWLFDVNWNGKYSAERITRYAKKYLDKRSQLKRQDELKQLKQKKQTPEITAAAPEQVANIINAVRKKLKSPIK